MDAYHDLENQNQNKNPKIDYFKTILLSRISKERIKASNLIKKQIRSFIFIKRELKKAIIKRILKFRKKSIRMLQQNIIYFINKKYVKEILRKERNYTGFTYSKPCKKASIQIYDLQPYRTDTSEIFDLEYCRLRKFLIAYVKADTFLKSKYYFHFIIDGNMIISPDYLGEKNNSGDYFNVFIPKRNNIFDLDSTNETYEDESNNNKHNTFSFKRKNLTSILSNRNSISSKENKIKKVTTLYKFKNIFNSYSTSELCNLKPKTILRKSSDSKIDISKKVAFNNKVEFSS